MAVERTQRRWWTSIGLGAVLCLGCCLAPLLIAAGLLGGGAVLVTLSWVEPVGFALIGVGIVGLIWSRRRGRCRADDAEDSTCASTGCGCSPVAAG